MCRSIADIFPGEDVGQSLVLEIAGRNRGVVDNEYFINDSRLPQRINQRFCFTE
jgi:hypothetical protein